ncbi:MAG: RidA family protein [Verrucomicrobiota bacterium]
MKKKQTVELPTRTNTLPFSTGIIAEGRFLFVSGQGPWDPERKTFVRGSIGEQTRLTLECIQRVVEAAGTTMENAVSCRVYLQQLTEITFSEMNDAYALFFGAEKPVRTTVGCQLLNIDVEIDCIFQIP